MSEEARYASGSALWAAATDRARTQYGRSGTSAAMRRLVFERFLARVFATGHSPFVLKGGNAVLARVIDARSTKDVDLLHREQDLEEAVELLREACANDVGDHFRFEVGTVRAMLAGDEQPGVEGRRVEVSAYCGTRVVPGFGVDLVVGSLMTTAPEQHLPPPVVPLRGLSLPSIPLYPAVDHIADKVCATQALYGSAKRRSSRVRDLVDLVILARNQSLEGLALISAVRQEWAHRGLEGPVAFDPPMEWASRYRSEAAKTPACAGVENFEAAVELVVSFLAPVLDGSAEGHLWHPESLTWSSPEST